MIRTITLLKMILLSFSIISKGQTAELSTHWLVLNYGLLKVQGNTNLNSFSFSIPGYKQKDTLSLTNKYLPTGQVLANGSLTYNVSDFDCGNSIMNRHLRKTLRSSEFPQIAIKFISLEKLPEATLNSQTIKTLVEIHLAGSIKRLHIACLFEKMNNGLIRVKGEQYVNFTDFGIMAPSNMGGLLKTKDRLKVEFTLFIRAIGSNSV